MNYEIVTSSTKLEMHNVSQRRQTGPSHDHRQHAQKLESSLCGFRVTRADRQTDRQTDVQLVTILRTPLADVNENLFRLSPESSILRERVVANYKYCVATFVLFGPDSRRYESRSVPVCSVEGRMLIDEETACCRHEYTLHGK